MHEVRSFSTLLLLPHRRMIGIAFSHPLRTEPIGTPSFHFTYNPVVRERRHGKGISRMWEENNIYWLRFYTSGFSGFPDPPVFICKKISNDYYPRDHWRSSIRVFKEKWNTAYYAKYLNDPQL